MVNPRTRARCAAQPAMQTGVIATVDAADILTQKSPSLVMTPEILRLPRPWRFSWLSARMVQIRR